MEQRITTPVECPMANPTRPMWQDPPSRLANYTSSPQLPGSASIVIVGSGISGTVIAWNLLQKDPSQSIVMIEAREACSGATGRNGGHTKCASYRSFLRNARSLGVEEAAKIARFEYENMRAVHSFAKEQLIDCDGWLGRTVDVMQDPTQWEHAKTAVNALRETLGKDDPAADYEVFGAEETGERFFVPDSFGSISYEAGSLSAYKLVTGILELALQDGLKLYTNTIVHSLAQEAHDWTVTTNRGTLKATRVILATNGYTAALLPELQGVIIPLKGQVTSQRRGQGMPPPNPPMTYSFINSQGYEYLIQRPLGTAFAGDIVIGGGLTSGKGQGLYEYGSVNDTIVDNDIISYLKDCTPRYFGHNWGHDDPAGRIRTCWSGIMGYSGDNLPFVGQVPGRSNLFLCAAFQGHGMVLSFLSAKALVARIYEDETAVPSFPHSFRITEARMKKPFTERLQLNPQEDSLRYSECTLD